MFVTVHGTARYTATACRGTLGSCATEFNRKRTVLYAAITLAMCEARTERHAVQATRPMPARMLLFDVKGVHGGTQWYATARARQDQSGAVAARARDVELGYRRHTRELDQYYYGPHSTTILDHLDSFTAVRGLCVGHYGEASRDVHALIDIAATGVARRQQGSGARVRQTRHAASLSLTTVAHSGSPSSGPWHATWFAASPTLGLTTCTSRDP